MNVSRHRQGSTWAPGNSHSVLNNPRMLNMPSGVLFTLLTSTNNNNKKTNTLYSTCARKVCRQFPSLSVFYGTVWKTCGEMKRLSFGLDSVSLYSLTVSVPQYCCLNPSPDSCIINEK